MVCEIFFCSEFPNILDKAGRKTRKRRRRSGTQVVTKRYALDANATNKKQFKIIEKRCVCNIRQNI